MLKRELTKIGVVGLGTMGLGIAQVFASAGHSVLVTDADQTARSSAIGRMRATLQLRVTKGAMNTAEVAAMLARIIVVDDLQFMVPADLVIEAIAEVLAAKRELLRRLEAVCPAQTVLATNTSSLSVASIADGMTHPDRVLGLHFFNPAQAMKLVELIGHGGTSQAALTLARDATKAGGKTVIDAPDRPGFIVNRCARPFYGEAFALGEEGVSPAEIDAAMVAAGYRIGPYSLIDLIGADINLAATEGLFAGMQGHPRYHVFAALRSQVAGGLLGRKAGHGFIFPNPPIPPTDRAPQIALRIEAALINEACWLLSEGGVTAESIDLALKLGLNFPYGPFEALARYGRARILDTLTGLENSAPAHLKGRYEAAPSLSLKHLG